MATASDDYISWEPLNLPLGVKVQQTDLQIPLKIVSQRKYIFPMSILAGLEYEKNESDELEIPATSDKKNRPFLGYYHTNDKTIHDFDDRTQVYPTTSLPHIWICALFVHYPCGKIGRGTGFRINLKSGLDKQVILTSAHCLFIPGWCNLVESVPVQYPSEIHVCFPGKEPQTVTKSDSYWISPMYIKTEARGTDYAVIVLPGKDSEGFSVSPSLEDKDLACKLATISGFPGDRPEGTMWTSSGLLEKVTKNRVFYFNDTYRGQSGSPVYINDQNGKLVAVGIHSAGGYPNSALRITNIVLEQIIKFIS